MNDIPTFDQRVERLQGAYDLLAELRTWMTAQAGIEQWQLVLERGSGTPPGSWQQAWRNVQVRHAACAADPAAKAMLQELRAVFTSFLARTERLATSAAKATLFEQILAVLDAELQRQVAALDIES